MKKITLGIVLVFTTIVAMADTIRETGSFVSACGVTWNYVIHYNEGLTDSFTLMNRFLHISALEDKADAACGTSTTLITNSVDPDLNDPSTGPTAPDGGSNQGPISTIDDQW